MPNIFYLTYSFLFFIITICPELSISQDEIFNNLNNFKKELKNKEIQKKKLIILENSLQKKLNILNNNLSVNQKKLNKIKKNKGLTNKSLKKIGQDSTELKNNLILFQKNKNKIITKLIQATWDDNQEFLQTIVLSNYLIKINKTIHQNKLKIKNLDELEKLSKEKAVNFNNNLDLLNKKIRNDQVQLKGIIGETIIAAIEKKENTKNIQNISQKAQKLKILLDQLAKKSLNKNNNLTKGILTNNLLPLSNTYIENITTQSNNTGIIITTKKSGRVISPEKGLVVYASYFRGYGNMVILDLGNNLHLILSGLKNINCFVGDWLKKGDKIGFMGEKKYDKKLYLEVRKNGKTLNPNDWNKYSKVN